MANDLRSLIPLLTISRGGTTLRFAAWPESIRSHGEQFEPHPFMFVLDERDRLATWKRVEIHLNRAELAAAFPAPLPGGGPILASVQVVSERDCERILHRLDGIVTLDRDRVYFEPASKPSA